MVIGGLQKFSLLDYPEHLSAVIFSKGCNFRCQFCYNPMLVWPEEEGKFNNITSSEEDGEIKMGHPQINESDLFDFLISRTGRLDAVVITGGEPTLHSDLPEFIEKIKKQGYKIKLDTNGTNPKMLMSLLSGNLLDYLAMDIKGPEKKYDLVTGVQPNLKDIKKSVKIIKESGLPYEFRTTVVPGLVKIADIAEMAKLISGAEKWFLQNFKSDIELVNESFNGEKPYSYKEMEEMKKIAEKYVKLCQIR
jgi:pyruvate formate lyase activating enzyme